MDNEVTSSLVWDKEGIKDNLKVIEALSIVLKALAYGETIEIEGKRIQMQGGLLYCKGYHYINGEFLDPELGDTTAHLGLSHLPWEYWIRVVSDLSDEQLDSIKWQYAVRATLNNVDKPSLGVMRANGDLDYST